MTHHPNARGAGLLVLLALAAGCSSSPTPGATTPPTGAETAPAPLTVTAGPPPPPGRVGPPVVGISTLAPVPVAAPADFGNGLVATVKDIRQIPQLEAHGPGEIAGPGVSVVVEIRNGTPSPIDLSGVVVNASYANSTPASDSSSPPFAPLTGQLPAGETKAGTYVFQVPQSDWKSTVVEINWNGSPNVVLVRQ